MLAAGTRVGPYEIVSWLGAGGMGEVYRARDTKLHREVALKTLPEELARDPDRLSRLRHEARLLASLNHPGIATVHGLEEFDGGVPVLVMELVEGETLSSRPRSGVREALKVAHQIAVALEAAHEKGVLHRDLKPDNIRLGPGGRVKLLDFGLAKAVRGASSLDSKLSTETNLFQKGGIAGTAAYMSPEQARGQEVDRRTDVWAFGCVLYEMLSGKKAFAGATFSDTLAAVLDREPDWSALPRDTPRGAVHLMRRCLRKEREARLRDIGDVRLDLEELLTAPESGEEAGSTSAGNLRAEARPSLPLRLALLVGAGVAGAALWALLAGKPSAERPVVRMAIPLPSPESIAGVVASAVAISPDGTQLAYVASRGGRAQLYLRALDRLESRAIPGTEGADTPFFSPDGQWVGFCSRLESKLKKVPVGGGTALTMGTTSGLPRGATWGPDGTIVFARDAASALYRMQADGGTGEPLTKLEAARHETSHRLPEFLPDGQAVLFTVKFDDTTIFDEASIEVISLRTLKRSVLIAGGTNPRYAAGHLFYERAGSLWAAPFDAHALELTGPSALVVEGVANTPDYGSADFAVSRDGSLVYVPGKARGVDRRLVRVTRAGKVSPLAESRRGFEDLRLSPDGRRLAVDVAGANNQIWIYDLERGTLSPQTVRFNNMTPIWTPDGRRLTFASDREGPSLSIFWQPADGSGSTERLATNQQHWVGPVDWTPDGETLLVEDFVTRGLWALPLRGDRTPRPVFQGPFNHQLNARLSPNGRWLAFVSNESGRPEVYVRDFPALGGRTLVSTDGGVLPAWSRNGRELFYLERNRMMAATVTSEGAFAATKPRPLFESKIPPPPDGGYQGYDVTPDGDFLFVEPGESDAPQTQIDVVVNWLQEVRQRVAAAQR